MAKPTDDPGPADPVPPPVRAEPVAASAGASAVADDHAAPPLDSGRAASDGELVRAIAAGERAALATLYDRHAARLLSLARRLMNNSVDGEDLLHDLFLEVWQRAYQYSAERGSVTTWLVLRLRSRAIDRLRSASYRRLLSQHEDAAQAATSSVAWSGPWTAERPDRAASDGHLQRALAELPDHTQAILQLVYFRGLSLTEVAAQLVLPIGTVKSRLHRALRSLRSAVTLPPEESGR